MRLRNRLPELMGRKRVRSLRQLSQQIEVPYPTLWNFKEEKSQTLNVVLITKLCEYFGCDVGDLFYIDYRAKDYKEVR